jgi:hypothetical protein
LIERAKGPLSTNVKITRATRVAKYFSGQTGLPVFSTPRRGLIDFLEKLRAGLGTHQTVGEEFTQKRLTEMSAEFNLTDSDWGGPYCMIHRLRE